MLLFSFTHDMFSYFQGRAFGDSNIVPIKAINNAKYS